MAQVAPNQSKPKSPSVEKCIELERLPVAGIYPLQQERNDEAQSMAAELTNILKG